MIETLDTNLFHLATLPCSSLMQSSMQRRVNDFFSLSTCSMSGSIIPSAAIYAPQTWGALASSVDGTWRESLLDFARVVITQEAKRAHVLLSFAPFLDGELRTEA